MTTKRPTASTEESRWKTHETPRDLHVTKETRKRQDHLQNTNPILQTKNRRGSVEMLVKSEKQENKASSLPVQGRRGSNSSQGSLENQIPKPSNLYSKFNPGRGTVDKNSRRHSGTEKLPFRETRRASDPGPEQVGLTGRTGGKQGRRPSDFEMIFNTAGDRNQGQNVPNAKPKNSKQQRGDSDVGLYDTDVKYTEVHCTSCQRKGRKAKGHFYCHDCQVGLCERCAKEHVQEVTMNRHSVSVITKTFMVSPNQGPFPNLTQIGQIKLDQEISVRGSAFLPSGVLLIADFTNCKIRMFTGDYTRKHVASLTLQKENKWDENKPKPLDITDISSEMFALTTSTGCIYIVTIGVSMLMKIERIITVIRFESNYGECHGLAYNSADDSLYVGCTTDREGTYFNIYGLDGVQRRTIRNCLTDVPEYLAFGIDKTKLYSADSDSVTVYDVRDFSMVEQYTELQAQTRDILVDKYGYLYTLAQERRTFKSPGSIYRLEPNRGVTKVTALEEKPSSICYCARNDTVAVTFNLSRYILLYKLVLRSYEKQYSNEIKPYEKRK